ncbi:hypothetical protein [Streptomyces sp. NPDC058228]|uniref:hypothetical protein n=1 Tax=unclassified Streptomyces TaxID=2593676 RepID=UPI0036EBC9F5
MDAPAFPCDLVQASAGTTPAAPCPPGDTALRRRLLRLSVRLWWHPYWSASRSVPAARTGLRQPARSGEAVRSA